MSTLSKIKALIPYLPLNDVELGYKFLNNREFESLIEIINSAIYKYNKYYKAGIVNENYQHTTNSKLMSLKNHVDNYCCALDIVNDDEIIDLDEDLVYD